jgi:hypothetical protein
MRSLAIADHLAALRPHLDPALWQARHGLRLGQLQRDWAQEKYKRLKPVRKARKWWNELTARQPHLFAHRAWMNSF